MELSKKMRLFSTISAVSFILRGLIDLQRTMLNQIGQSAIQKQN